jgi:hypothetical protein
MSKRFLISTAAMFIMSMAIGFLVHGYLLAPEYAQLPGLFRTEADSAQYFPYIVLANLCSSVAITWLYLKTKGDRPVLIHGAMFGLAIAALMIIPRFLIYYAVQPMPGAMVIKQIIFDTIGLVLMGIAIAYINQPTSRYRT